MFLENASSPSRVRDSYKRSGEYKIPRRNRDKDARLFPAQSSLNTLLESANATLAMGDLKLCVKKPILADENEWIAVKITHLLEDVKLLRAVCSNNICTEQSCRVMTAGAKYEYLWPMSPSDVPMKVSAPEYMRLLSNWIYDKLRDPSLCPVEPGVPFPPKFKTEMKQILKRMFRVYAHIYLHHLRQFANQNAVPHLNRCFKQFLYFVEEFQLVAAEDMDPLKPVINAIKMKNRGEDHTESLERQLQLQNIEKSAESLSVKSSPIRNSNRNK